MNTHTETSLCALLSISLRPVALWFQRKMLERQIKQEQRYIELFQKEAETARVGSAYSQKKVLLLKAQLRDMGAA